MKGKPRSGLLRVSSILSDVSFTSTIFHLIYLNASHPYNVGTEMVL